MSPCGPFLSVFCLCLLGVTLFSFSFEFTANEAAPFDLFDPRRDKRGRLQARGKHAHSDAVATCTLVTRIGQTRTH